MEHVVKNDAVFDLQRGVEAGVTDDVSGETGGFSARWTFHNKAAAVRLGELEFRPGERIRSREYKNPT